jgi:hypothetical protein
VSRAPQYGIARAPAGDAGRSPSTPHQRLYARTLKDQLGLSTIDVASAHNRHFKAAGLEPRGIGRRVDAVLVELTRGEIARLIESLRQHQRQGGEG